MRRRCVYAPAPHTGLDLGWVFLARSGYFVMGFRGPGPGVFCLIARESVHFHIFIVWTREAATKDSTLNDFQRTQGHALHVT